MPDIGGIERVKRFVAQKGLDTAIQELDSTTRSSALAAQALGCSVAEIAKSVVFCGEQTVVVVISGDRRVDAGKLSKLVGSPLVVASPDEVRMKTGYVIGGVPPFPHNDRVLVFADSSLARFDQVWTASGAQNAVMKISTRALTATIGRPVQDLAQQ
ncbi:MAG: YbaK/EbsC family protein [Thaumarchaeota archaeon]|nr:YbaK/EbsC family protein [Nitrososphaerota archaeon]